MYNDVLNGICVYFFGRLNTVGFGGGEGEDGSMAGVEGKAETGGGESLMM